MTVSVRTKKNHNSPQSGR